MGNSIEAPKSTALQQSDRTNLTSKSLTSIDSSISSVPIPKKNTSCASNSASLLPAISSSKNHLKNTNKHKNKNKNVQQWFIDYHRMYNVSNGNIDVSKLNPNRIVFISITGLYQSWNKCPPFLLLNAIIIVPLKREWIDEPDKYPDHPYKSLLNDENLLMLLRWKDSQGLAFFMRRKEEKLRFTNPFEEKTESESNAISCEWQQISTKLQQLYDPINKRKYRALIFNQQYWSQNAEYSVNSTSHQQWLELTQRKSQYMISHGDIMQELTENTLRYKTMQTILIESNPTLNVVIYFDPNVNIQCRPTNNDNNDEEKTDELARNREMDEMQRVIENDDNWWMADDYFDDEYDANAINQFHEYLDYDSEKGDEANATNP